MNRRIIKFTLLFFLLSLNLIVFAQEWEQCYTNATTTAMEIAFDAKQTHDGGYVIVGGADLPTGAIRHYVKVIKTDEDGNFVWELTPGFGSIASQEGQSVLILPDSSIIIGGYANEQSFNDTKFLLMKVSPDGQHLWSKTHGTTATSEICKSIKIATDGGFIMAGYRMNSNNNFSAVITKTDINGDSIWMKSYLDATGDYSKFNDIVLASDGGYVACGNYNGQATLVKIDEDGNVIWQKNHGFTTGDEAHGIALSNDGDYAVCGTGSGIAGELPIVFKTDQNGVLLWSQMVPVNTFVGASSITNAPNDGYAITGFLDEFWNQTIDTSGYFVQLDATGNIVCQNFFPMATSQRMRTSSIAPTNDGHFVLAGSCDFGMFLRKTKCEGSNANTNISTKVDFQLWPNPNSGTLNAQLNSSVEYQQLRFYLYDVNGKKVMDLNNLQNQFKIESIKLSQGIYFYQLFNGKQMLDKGKLIFN